MVKITVKILGPGGPWGILKNGKVVDEETSKVKAEMAAEWYKEYFRGNVSEEEAHKRFKRESREENDKSFGGVF